MATIIEAPNEVYNVDIVNHYRIFLAGGISNCPDWQTELIKKIESTYGIVIYNPRRKNFPMNDPKVSEEQITWEYLHLKDSDFIIYWFSRGSLNPITLFELGRWGLSGNKRIVIGIDPLYERKQDVIIQTKLSRPHTEILWSINEIADVIMDIEYM